MTRDPLWSCPKCGAKLVAKNPSHACGPFSVDAFLEGKSAVARELYERFVDAVARAGPFDVAPAKTRVAFLSRVRFASVNRLGASSIDVHFVLPRAIASPRIRRVEKVGKVFVHHLRLASRDDFDAELRAWLRAARVEYGDRGGRGGGVSRRG